MGFKLQKSQWMFLITSIVMLILLPLSLFAISNSQEAGSVQTENQTTNLQFVTPVYPFQAGVPTYLPAPTSTPMIDPSTVRTQESLNTITAEQLRTPMLMPLAENTFYVSTSGSDSNPGTYQKPWRTINKAAQSLSSGQTAIVLAGTYPERINLSRSGIILKAQGKVLMKGFTVYGSTNQVVGFSISDRLSDAGLEVHGDNNLFQDNEIYHMRQDGIWFHGSGNTYRGNYIHDILDPSIGGDPHVDCFQTWTWGGPVLNTLFEGNTCEHTRRSGSNQIAMIESKNAEISNLVFRDNIFIMHDAGYTPLRVNRKSGQYPITNVQVLNNIFENVSGSGDEAISLIQVEDIQISGNTVIGYRQVSVDKSCSNIQASNNNLQ
jgi:hypothetical protein